MDNYNNFYQGGNQNPYNSPAPKQKSNKKIWLLILIPLFVILIGVIIFLFMNSSSKTISENEFTQGTNFQLKETKEAKFIIDNEEHTIKVNSVSDDSVNLIIQSNPIQVDIKIGETKKVDLNNDGFYDIQVKLNDIKDGVPEIYIKKIHESTCTENWDCEDWSSCSEQGSQIRTCTDLNSCGTTKNKPATTQSCTYVETCVEDWECTDWTTSTNLSISLDLGDGQGDGSYSCVQVRNCTDSNRCGTELEKPEETRECPGGDENFEEKFENCLSGGNITVYPFGDAIQYYTEILGPEGDLCRIKYKYLKHPDPNYEGKEMICKLDTSLGYSHTYQLTDDICEGELWDVQSNPSTCDNDGKCEWDDGETISNCPDDCLGSDQEFFSDQTCEWSSDCNSFGEYPICVVNICASPTQALKDFIEANYETENCAEIPCDNCEHGTFHPTSIGYHGFELDFCTECSKDSFVFPCNEGYTCEMGLCVSE